jgi:aspartyl-tRNA(Asn)/glutamyl-tRNA(Gln) amidotransferase subunit C
MTLTRAEVDHIALLARLDLTDEEKIRFQQQLSDILEYVAQLQKLDTTKVAPTSGVLQAGSRLRADEPRAGLTTREALQNAPETEDQQFRVPPVLE